MRSLLTNVKNLLDVFATTYMLYFLLAGSVIFLC